MNGYELSRNWFDFCFENPEKIKPNHTALYFFAVEHCNRLGWKAKFGLPTTMSMEAIGIRSYNTYIKTLNDLVEFGFINLIEKSRNQYSSNIVALSNFNKALDKALDKALIKHTTKQSESTQQSIDSIDKQINKEPIKPNNDDNLYKSVDDLANIYLNDDSILEAVINNKDFPLNSIDEIKLKMSLFLDELKAVGETTKIRKDFNTHFRNWVKKKKEINDKKPKSASQKIFGDKYEAVEGMAKKMNAAEQLKELQDKTGITI